MRPRRKLIEPRKIGNILYHTEIFENDLWYWVGECECGTQVKRRQNPVLQAERKGEIHSCGCKHPSKFSNGQNHIAWRGVGDMSSRIFIQLTGKARERDLSVNISKDDLWNQFTLQEKKCSLTGRELDITSTIKHRPTASVDRIDSSKGYEKDNIQWIHKDVNIMKNDLTQERFIELALLVANNN